MVHRAQLNFASWPSLCFSWSDSFPGTGPSPTCRPSPTSMLCDASCWKVFSVSTACIYSYRGISAKARSNPTCGCYTAFPHLASKSTVLKRIWPRSAPRRSHESKGKTESSYQTSSGCDAGPMHISNEFGTWTSSKKCIAGTLGSAPTNECCRIVVSDPSPSYSSPCPSICRVVVWICRGIAVPPGFVHSIVSIPLIGDQFDLPWAARAGTDHGLRRSTFCAWKQGSNSQSCSIQCCRIYPRGHRTWDNTTY